MTEADGTETVTHYTFDSGERLRTVRTGDGTTNYSYDQNGNLQAVKPPNRTSVEYVYDDLNRLNSIDITNTITDTAIAGFSYTLDPTGRRTAIEELDGTKYTYGYDDLYRLVSETLTAPDESVLHSASYTYDKVGNRTEQTVNGVTTGFDYNRNDWLLQSGGVHYAYDNNGNTLTETEDGTITASYLYNSQNQMVESVSNGLTTTYGYNADGIRTRKSSNGIDTLFTVDSNRDYAQVVLENSANDKRYYHYGLDLISQYTEQNGYQYYGYDGLGSTRLLTNEQGTLSASYRYDAWGELLDSTGDIENPYTFAGEQMDEETGLQYLRARYLNPEVGRFTSMDTWMGSNFDPPSLHKYTYVHNSPINNIDPSGHMSMASVGSGLSIAGNLAGMALTTYDVFQIATGEEELSAKNIGSALIFNALGGSAGKAIGFFGKKFKNKYLASGCSRNSFIAGTSVHTESGLRPIESISIGDLVWAANPETGENSLKPVTHLIQGEQEYELYIITFATGEVITASADHPFFVDNQWVNAKDLLVGNSVLILGDGRLTNIINIRSEVKNEKVFNLTVGDFHTYHIGEAGYLVHNTNIFCSQGITAVFPKVHISGLVRNRNLTELSGNEIANAFSKSGYKLSSHAIQRIKDPRHRAYGINTLADVANK